MSNVGVAELLIILLLLLFLALAVFAVVFVARALERRASASKTKKCPFCAETIRAEARVCRFCNREQVV